MPKQSDPSPKKDGRKAAKPRKRTVADKPTPPAPTLDSVMELFQENLSSEKRQTLSLVSVRIHLESMVRDAKFIDQPKARGPEGGETDISAEELTRALKGLVKAGKLLREVVPGLFLKQTRAAQDLKQIGIARLALARYLAALEGIRDAQGIMRAQGQLDTLLRGGRILLIPAVPPSGTTGPSPEGIPSQSIHLGETPLLDFLLPQWRKIGDPAWTSPLGRYRGNWIEQAFMPAYELLSKKLLMLFLLRGWPMEALTQKRSQARTTYYEVFGQILEVSKKPRIASRSISSHLDQACHWAETEEARMEMDFLLEMDRAHARDAQVLARKNRHHRQL